MLRAMLKKRAEVLAEINIHRKKSINVGSSKENDIVIKEKNISEHHCTITLKDDKYELKDNNTLSGTQVDGRSITVHELQIGSVINVGSHSIVLRSAKRLKGASKGQNGPYDTEAGSEAADESPMYLLGIYGKFEGKKYEIRIGDTFMGREEATPKGVPNDIVLKDDMTVSKGHAKITRSGKHCMLTDIGSTGGVAVNGAKVGQLNDVDLNKGDEIAIGRSIFRLEDEDDNDYSYPKKYGAGFLKFQRIISRVVTFSAVAASLFYMGRGLYGIYIIHDVPPKIAVNFDEMWSAKGNMPHDVPGEYDITSSPAVADLNKDGINDIIFINSSGQASAWNGKTGELLWQPVEIQKPGKSSPAIADMNNDGVEDIVILSGTSMLYVIDGQSGVIIFKDMLGGTVWNISPAVGDLNMDGKKDIVVCSEEGTVYFIYSAGFELEIEKFSESVEAPVYASPIIISNKKISPLVVVCSYNSKLFLFNGSSRDKKTIDLAEKTGKAHLIEAAPCIGDTTGDGIPEIAVQSSVPQYVSLIDIRDFSVKWTYFVDPVPPEGLKHHSSPLISDMNKDGLGDVWLFSANGTIYGLKGKTGYPAGELMWKLSLPEANRMVSSAALYDFNKDGVMDAVIGGEGGSIYIVDGFVNKRETNRIIAVVKASNAPITSSVIVGDIDNDGTHDIVYSDAADSLHVLRTNLRTFKNTISWPMYLGSSLRSSEPLRSDIQPFVIMALAASGMLIAVLIIKVTFWKKEIHKRPKIMYI